MDDDLPGQGGQDLFDNYKQADMYGLNNKPAPKQPTAKPVLKTEVKTFVPSFDPSEPELPAAKKEEVKQPAPVDDGFQVEQTRA